MFTQSLTAPAPAPSSPGLHAASPTSPASPTSRSSRLRGLSYLRNYTQSHLLNREHSAGPSNTATAGATTGSSASAVNSVNSANSSQSGLQPAANAPPSPSSAAGDGLVRPETYPLRQTQSAAAASPSAAAAAADPRLCLVPVVAHPLSASTRSLLGDDLPASLSSSPRQQTGVPSAPASAAISSLQAYRTDLPSSASASALPPTASTTAASLTANALATSAAAAEVMTRSRSATEPGAGLTNAETLPSIRFSTFYDPRSTRPSLKFTPMSRTLPTGKEVIRVGRYSERDSQPNASPHVPSAAHVGFKSKVVSRRHCEFWYEDNRWFIKDVKSSSGTFLNHIRLSQPGTESKPFPVNDGDIVQLGIDFKGGEEMIFRCVKMRVELNRGWQNKLNAFNVTTHKRLRNMTKTNEADGAAQSSQDCSICLNSIAPCQSLFVAPCSHTWHYKCIRALLDSPQYPSFICPNCRAAVDLEADVEDPPEEWEQMDMEEAEDLVPDEGHAHHVMPRPPSDQRTGEPQRANVTGLSLHASHADTSEIADTTMHVDSIMEDAEPPPIPVLAHQRDERKELDSQPQQQQEEVETHVSHATSHPVPIPTSSSGGRFSVGSASAANVSATAARQARTPSPTERHVAPHPHEGPITPRNDAGPWVFDGSGIRIGSSRASTDSRRGEMRSLDTAAAEISGQFSN